MSIRMASSESLSVTWMFECMTFKIPEALFWLYLISLWSWPLNVISNQSIFVPNCIKVVNLVNFPPAVCLISFSQTFSIWSWGHMDSLKTECLLQLFPLNAKKYIDTVTDLFVLYENTRGVQFFRTKCKHRQELATDILYTLRNKVSSCKSLR